MAKASLKEIDQKIEKGEELTPDEVKEVMSAPSQDMIVNDPEDEELFKNAIDLDEPKKEEIKEPPKEEKKEEKKAAEAPPAKEEPSKDEPNLDKVHQELEKPVGQEDLSGFSRNEKGLFWEMKRERQARQKAEEERDVLRLDKLRREQTPKEEKETPIPEVPDDEFVSGKQLKEIIKSIKTEKKPESQTAPAAMNGMLKQYNAMCEQVAKTQYDDYEEVIEAANDILLKNPAYKQQLLNAYQTGDNPAIIAYHLTKGDPAFDKALVTARARLEARNPKKKEPAKEEPKKEPEPKKVDEAKEKEKKIEENSNKAKTSGSFGGGETGGEPGLTLEELRSMSDDEFRKIPKAKRDKILMKYGA
jgi:hypothetical protein